MKPDVIIQARMGSIRLPGKVLLKIIGKPMLEYVIERVEKARNIGDVIVATTSKKEDDLIVDLIKRLGKRFYRGLEDDVLDRYYQAATILGSEHIVRITADCPLIDPVVIDRVIDCYRNPGADYCSNTIEETFPDGQDVEVFNFKVLREAWQNAKLASEREHVTPYIKKNGEKFKLVNLKNENDLSDKRWTLDQEEDFIFIKQIIESLYPENPDFGMDDILCFLKSNPQVEDINNFITRNQGYRK